MRRPARAQARGTLAERTHLVLGAGNKKRAAPSSFSLMSTLLIFATSNKSSLAFGVPCARRRVLLSGAPAADAAAGGGRRREPSAKGRGRASCRAASRLAALLLPIEQRQFDLVQVVRAKSSFLSAGASSRFVVDSEVRLGREERRDTRRSAYGGGRAEGEMGVTLVEAP